MAVYAFYESFLSVFITITHSEQLMPSLHVFVIKKAMENHLLLQLVSQSRTSSRVATNYKSAFYFLNKCKTV